MKAISCTLARRTGNHTEDPMDHHSKGRDLFPLHLHVLIPTKKSDSLFSFVASEEFCLATGCGSKSAVEKGKGIKRRSCYCRGLKGHGTGGEACTFDVQRIVTAFLSGIHRSVWRYIHLILELEGSGHDNTPRTRPRRTGTTSTFTIFNRAPAGTTHYS